MVSGERNNQDVSTGQAGSAEICRTGMPPGRQAPRSRQASSRRRSRARAGGGGVRVRGVAGPLSGGDATHADRLAADDGISYGRVRGDGRRTIRRRSGASCASACSTTYRWRHFINWMARRRTLRASARAMRRCWAEAQPCLAIMGIGENGHLAFIDPPVCDFERSAGRAGGGTRRRLPDAAGARRGVRPTGGCAAPRAVADRAVLPAGAAGVGICKRRRTRARRCGRRWRARLWRRARRRRCGGMLRRSCFWTGGRLCAVVKLGAFGFNAWEREFWNRSSKACAT